MFDSEIFNAFFTLVGVTAFLGIVLLAFKRYTRKANNKTGVKIKVVERTALSQKSSLVIAEVNGGQYLLGVTENNINILKELKETQASKEKEKKVEKVSKESLEQNINSDDLSFKSFLQSTITNYRKMN